MVNRLPVHGVTDSFSPFLSLSLLHTTSQLANQHYRYIQLLVLTIKC